MGDYYAACKVEVYPLTSQLQIANQRAIYWLQRPFFPSHKTPSPLPEACLLAWFSQHTPYLVLLRSTSHDGLIPLGVSFLLNLSAFCNSPQKSSMLPWAKANISRVDWLTDCIMKILWFDAFLLACLLSLVKLCLIRQRSQDCSPLPSL